MNITLTEQEAKSLREQLNDLTGTARLLSDTAPTERLRTVMWRMATQADQCIELLDTAALGQGVPA